MRFYTSLDLKQYPLHVFNEFENYFKPKIILSNEVYFKNGTSFGFQVGKLKSSVIYNLDHSLPGSYLLKPCHGNRVVFATDIVESADGFCTALQKNKSSSNDVTKELKDKLAIRTADCLAVAFVYEDDNVCVAGLSHAGWRGLCGGILQNTLLKMEELAFSFGVDAQKLKEGLHIHISPAIFGTSYECGSDVYNALILRQQQLFNPSVSNKDIFWKLYSMAMNLSGVQDGKIYPDLQLLAILELIVLGIQEKHIEVVRENTYDHPTLYSFRTAYHKKTDSSLRQWTHLMIPFF